MAMEIVDDIKNDIVNGIGGLRGKHARALDPKTVISAIQKEAKRNSKEWGDNSRPEAPNRYTVKISPEDWRKYYGTRREAMEERVAKKIYLSLGQMGVSMEGYPVVELEEDASVMFGGVSVDAVFGERVEVPDDLFKRDDVQQHGWGIPRPAASPEVVAGAKTVPMNERESREWELPKTSPMNPNVTFDKGKSSRTAELISGESKLAVHVGDTVGVLRREEQDAPDVVLPWEEFPHASQDHGAFTYDEGEKCWVYENHGSWGTLVSSYDGDSYELGVGERVFLDDGDMMKFATDGIYVFSYSD